MTADTAQASPSLNTIYDKLRTQPPSWHGDLGRVDSTKVDESIVDKWNIVIGRYPMQHDAESPAAYELRDAIDIWIPTYRSNADSRDQILKRTDFIAAANFVAVNVAHYIRECISKREPPPQLYIRQLLINTMNRAAAIFGRIISTNIQVAGTDPLNKAHESLVPKIDAHKNAILRALHQTIRSITARTVRAGATIECMPRIGFF